MHGDRGLRLTRFQAVILVSLVLGIAALAQTPSPLPPGPKPADAPERWKSLIGIYTGGTPKHTVYILELNGRLAAKFDDSQFSFQPLVLFEDPLLGTYFRVEAASSNHEIRILRGTTGRIEGLKLLDEILQRIDPGQDGVGKVIVPTRSVEALRREALSLSPPAENRPFRQSDLLELVNLDATIHLDIRYATSNNFLGTPVYSQARAFLQRPAAEALLRIHQKLKPLAYGLLIHDAYRPWYVTKIFWDDTPPEGKIFVADPAQGSRHNRGCAVDLTLYDLATGKPVEMPGTYDEMSPRSFPSYPGGTSLQRWHRDLLRRAMESEGFSVYESEWWHFDYKDWKEYPILNVPFEKLDSVGATGSVH